MIDTDARLPDSGDADARAERLARAKAAAIASVDTVTIGSDTIVVVDGDVLGKPATKADAHRMLTRLSGRSHTVITGVAVDCKAAPTSSGPTP